MSDYTQIRHARRERVSSAMDGELKPIHGAWIPAIHAGMTILEGVMMKSDKVELGWDIRPTKNDTQHLKRNNPLSSKIISWH